MFRKSYLLIVALCFFFECASCTEDWNNGTKTLLLSSNITVPLSNISVVNGPASNVGKSMHVVPTAGSTFTSTASSSTSTTSIVIILVSLIAVACVITAIIAALFVMRRRFNFWRLDNGENGKNDTVDVETNSSENNEVAEKSEAQEQKVVSENENLLTVENTQAISQLENNNVVIGENANEQVKTTTETTTIITTTTVVTGTVENSENVTVAEQKTVLPEQTSSTSLIANVLNDLSESVVARLAARSPTKSDDSEKQPLNQEN